MPLYEHVFIARQDVPAQRVGALITDFSAIITGKGGEVPKTEYWGIRPLAYRIKKNRKGHYALLNLSATHEAVLEMERQMRIHDDILRFMTVRVEELDPEPSIPKQALNVAAEEALASARAEEEAKARAKAAEEAARATEEKAPEVRADEETGGTDDAAGESSEQDGQTSSPPADSGGEDDAQKTD